MSIQLFRQERLREPLEQYLDVFDEYRGVVEEVLKDTDDLKALEDHILDIVTDDRRREVFRYLSGPPMSDDDLKSLLDIGSFAYSRLSSDKPALQKLTSIAQQLHDRRRFPWVETGKSPTKAELETSVVATAALLAMRRLETSRRSGSKARQEQHVADFLVRRGLVEVETRKVANLIDAPGKGQFCRESPLGSRKADFIVGLYDGRTMPLECKVSNSALNSIKRLNNDAAVKAEAWRHDFGTVSVVPAAVLEGVFKLGSLQEAQDRGLVLFWAHDLESMMDWIDRAVP